MCRAVRLLVVVCLFAGMASPLWAANPNRGLAQQGPNGNAAANQAAMYYFYRRGRRGYGGGSGGGLRSNFPIFIDARALGYPMPGF